MAETRGCTAAIRLPGLIQSQDYHERSSEGVGGFPPPFPLRLPSPRRPAVVSARLFASVSARRTALVITRHSIRRALVARGLLSFRRRTIPLQKKFQKADIQ